MASPKRPGKSSKPEKITTEMFEKSLEKLALHGGILLGPDDEISWRKGAVDWRPTYQKQRSFRQGSVSAVTEFVQSLDCRMLFFLKHFGDTADTQGPCGSCDRCEGVSPSQTRLLVDSERLAVKMVLADLTSGARSAGKLYEEAVKKPSDLSRSAFEAILDLLAQQDWIEISRESFEKDGRLIHYRKAELLHPGSTVGAADIKKLEIKGTPFFSAEVGEKKKSKPLKKRRKKTKTKPRWN